MQVSQRSKLFNPYATTPGDGLFKTAFDVRSMEAEVGDMDKTNRKDTQSEMEKEDSKKDGTSDIQTSAADERNENKYHNLGLEITGSPLRQNLRNINSEKKIFHAPSLIFDRETEDDVATRGEEAFKKSGWYTKEVLNKEVSNQES